jgi:hypothetical protein
MLRARHKARPRLVLRDGDGPFSAHFLRLDLPAAPAFWARMLQSGRREAGLGLVDGTHPPESTMGESTMNERARTRHNLNRPSWASALPALAFVFPLILARVTEAKTTANSGIDYANECKLAGVPAPPNWGDTQKWQRRGGPTGTLTPTLLFYNIAFGHTRPDTRVYLYQTDGSETPVQVPPQPAGFCVALGRGTTNDDEAELLGVICQGETGDKVCFWDAAAWTLWSPSPTIPITTGTAFHGGAALYGKTKGGVCTQCHTGQNMFIVLPGTLLDIRKPDGSSLYNKNGVWPDPIVPNGWPQNVGPGPAQPASCSGCHVATPQGGNTAGRFPWLSSETGNWCGDVLRNAVERGFMPGGLTGPGYLALKYECSQPPPLGHVMTRSWDAGAINGRFVFGDQDSNIYAISTNGDLLYYKHSGYQNGTFDWSQAGAVVGNGWGGFKRVFTGGGGVIYAINSANDLLWYKHTGQVNGTATWAPGSGNVVGLGWSFEKVFATSNLDGVIYAVNPLNGDLLWYKHTGRNDGTFAWAAGSGGSVGSNWNTLSRLTAASNGVIYGIDTDQNLRWYKHTGISNGTFSWGAGTGNVVGSSWPTATLFAGVTGRLYAISGNSDLHWYHHLGYTDGTASWVDNNPRIVGTQWSFMPRP